MVADLSWVPRASALLDVALHDDGVEIAELVEGGVSYARIRALYPVEGHRYTAAIRRNLQAPGRVERLYKLLRNLELYREWFSDAPLSAILKMGDAHDRATGWLSPYEAPQQPDDAARVGMSRTIQNLHVLPLGLDLLAQYPFPGASDLEWMEIERLRFERMLRRELHHVDDGHAVNKLQYLYRRVLCVITDVDDEAEL